MIVGMGPTRDDKMLAGKISWSRLALLIVCASILLLAGPTEEKRISIYSLAANYSLPVSEQNGKNYVGLLEILEPLGTVSAQTSGNHWKLVYNDVQCEFIAGKRKIRIRGKNFDLPANFLLENGRGLVPLDNLSTLLPRILGGPVTFNEAARRLFVGNVAVHFTAQVIKTTPPKLVLNFSSAVNPTIATEPGKLRMEFTREAVVAPGSQLLTFDSTVMPSASFHENNGAAELVVSSTVPVMATFSKDGRTITIAPPVTAASVAPPATAGPAKLPPPAPITAAPSPLPAAVSAGTASTAPRFLVLIDAAHGGDERGAALSEQLPEKDITLALARNLRQELNVRGVATTMVRDADVTLTADQRADAANAAVGAMYICIHASSEGRGVRLYTAQLPIGSESRGVFLDWNTAQASYEQASQLAEASLAEALRHKQIAVRTLTASLRPLNNVAGAALAVEVAPATAGVAQLASPTYQQFIAAAIAAGVVEIRDQWKAEQK